MCRAHRIAPSIAAPMLQADAGTSSNVKVIMGMALPIFRALVRV